MALFDCLQVRLLSPDAAVPKRGSDGAAGFDIFSIEDGIVPARGKSIVSSGLAITVPSGTYGRIAPRSGLAAKHGISVGAGVIDRDFTGPVKVILFNHSDVDYGFSKGDRIAQLILERISIPLVAVVSDLIVTERGEEGFGSTDWTPVIFNRPKTKEVQRTVSTASTSSTATATATATGQPAWKIEALVDGDGGQGLKRTPKEEVQKIVDARVALKLSQAALAQRLNVPVKTIQEIESGKALENRATLAKIKRVLGLI